MPTPIWPVLDDRPWSSEMLRRFPKELVSDGKPIGTLYRPGRTDWFRLVAKYLSRTGNTPVADPESLYVDWSWFCVADKRAFSTEARKAARRHEALRRRIDVDPPPLMDRCLLSVPPSARPWTSAAWSPDSKRLALGDGKGIQVYEVGSGQTVASLASPETFHGLLWDEDEERLWLKGYGFETSWSMRDGELSTSKGRKHRYVDSESLWFDGREGGFQPKEVPGAADYARGTGGARLNASGRSVYAFGQRWPHRNAAAVGLAMSPEGGRCVVWSRQRVRMLGPAGYLTDSLDPHGNPSCAAFLGRSGIAWVQMTGRGSYLLFGDTGRLEMVHTVRFLPDGNLLFRSSQTLLAVDGETLEPVWRTPLQNWNRAGRSWIACRDSLIFYRTPIGAGLYDVGDGKAILEVATPGVLAFAQISPCGEFLATGGAFPAAVWRVR
ncbi:MAG TPA: hypothetical protein VGE01_12995 [Fimbriimonas sp.]